ncbi:MAG: hypothetical protein ACRCVT_07675 [Leadbetterella sp.]
MGHDVSPIGNHRLKTDNVVALAEDLASRLDVNIEYGYWGRDESFKLLEEEGGDRTVILGSHFKAENLMTFTLVDLKYQEKLLYEKFGVDIFYHRDFWSYSNAKKDDTTKYIAAQIAELAHPFYEMTSNEDDPNILNFFGGLYTNHAAYHSRWWQFCRQFVEPTRSNALDSEYLLQYRKSMMHYTLAFGGDTIYYLDDQSNALEGVGQGSENNMTWTDFEAHVKEKSADLLLDIPRFMLDEQYRKDFLSKDEYPLSFVDDFRDLR